MPERCSAEVDLFLGPGDFVARMHERYGLTRPIVQLPLFVERSEGDEPEQLPPHPRPYYLFVGRVEAVKNPRSLLEAWDKFAGADLLIAGTGSQSEALRVRASSNPRIRFLGHVSQSSLGHFYAHCLACLVPSSFYEVFPLDAARMAAVVAAAEDPPVPELETAPVAVGVDVHARVAVAQARDAMRALEEHQRPIFDRHRRQRYPRRAEFARTAAHVDEIAVRRRRLPRGHEAQPQVVECARLGVEEPVVEGVHRSRESKRANEREAAGAASSAIPSEVGGRSWPKSGKRVERGARLGRSAFR